MSKPLADLVAFLTANTADYGALGAARYVILLCFYVLLLVSLLLFVVNFRDDREQRRGRMLWLWLTRVLVGCMWFQGLLWTLPFGADNGLHYWLEQMAGRAADPRLAGFVSDVLLPHFALVNPLLFLAEFGFATAFILGLFVRIAGFGSLLMGLTLWLGVYDQRPGDPAHWAWSYIFLALLGGTLMVFSAGRALGADAWLRRSIPAVRDRRAVGMPLRILT